MARPSAASARISRWISALAPMSTPCVGSSRISTRGFVASQRASATFCWLPPESVPTGASIDGVRMAKSVDEALRLGALGGAIEQAEREPRRPSEASVVLAATDIAPMTPCCRRSSGT